MQRGFSFPRPQGFISHPIPTPPCLALVFIYHPSPLIGVRLLLYLVFGGLPPSPSLGVFKRGVAPLYLKGWWVGIDKKRGGMGYVDRDCFVVLPAQDYLAMTFFIEASLS